MGRFSGKKYEVGRRVNAIRMDVSCRQYNNNKKKNARDRQSQRRSQETSLQTSRRLQNARDRQSQRRSHSYAEDVTLVSHWNVFAIQLCS